MDQVSCNGTEARLWYCSSNTMGTHNCDHSKDIGVGCFAANASTQSAAKDSIRLVKNDNSITNTYNPDPHEGHVLVLKDGSWGDITWNYSTSESGDAIAKVVCRQLG